MAVTDLSNYAADVYIGGPFIITWFQAGIGTIKAGYVCEYDDADEITLCTIDANYAAGVAGLTASQEIDTVYTSGVAIPMYHLGVGTNVWVKKDADDSDMNLGRLANTSNATAGAIEPWDYTDAALRSDSVSSCIGRYSRTQEGTATLSFVKVILGI